MKLGRIVAQIPARGGSKRVPAKNLRYLTDRPMIAFAIDAALQCPLLEDVYVNTDSEELSSLGKQLGCRVYRRPLHLGDDNATGDDFTIDFIENVVCDTLVMVSPVCPLVQASDISNALAAYAASEVDTLISCSETHMQGFCGGEPININPQGPLAPSQMNAPISICNWAVTIWNTNKFRELYGRYKSGYCGENRLLWPIDPLRAVKISEEKDFRLADALMRGQMTRPNYDQAARYWNSSDGITFSRNISR